MYVDIPEYKRCCFCIPLRPGLLACGYIRLAIGLFVLISTIISAFEYERGTVFAYCLDIVTIITYLLDVGFTVSFIVACHQKNYKLLKYYYYYSITILVLSSIFLVIRIGLIIYWVSAHCTNCSEHIHYIPILVTGIIIKLLFMALEFYIIFLIRSEIAKLKSNATFKFVNIKNTENASGDNDRQLMMEKTEKVKYDRFESEDGGVYNKCEV